MVPIPDDELGDKTIFATSPAEKKKNIAATIIQ
jgi:hypothetical protein